MVAEEGRLPGAPRVGRRLHPRPRPQARQWRQHTEASRGCANLWIQGRAGDVRDSEIRAGGITRPDEAAKAAGVEAAVGVVQPVVVDRGRAIETSTAMTRTRGLADTG